MVNSFYCSMIPLLILNPSLEVLSGTWKLIFQQCIVSIWYSRAKTNNPHRKRRKRRTLQPVKRPLIQHMQLNILSSSKRLQRVLWIFLISNISMLQCVFYIGVYCNCCLSCFSQEQNWDQEKLLADWIVVCDQPFDKVEKPKFWRLLEYTHLRPSLHIPHHTAITKHIMTMGEDTVEGVRKMIEVTYCP